MVWHGTPYTFPIVTASAISALLGVYIWWRHQIPAARTIALIWWAGSGWLLGYMLELAGADLPTKVFWDQVMYIPVVTASAAWLIFTLQYTGREKWITRRNLGALLAVPSVTLILVFTNTYHNLIWTDIQIIEGPLIFLQYSHGLWFWVHTVYCYSSVLFGSLLLVQVLLRSLHLYRWQVISLLLASFFTVLCSVLDILGFYPFPYLYLVLLFPAASLAVAWSIFRFRPGDIVPVARGAIVDSMSDGVIVLDPQDRIVDVNPSAQNMINRPVSELMGEPIKEVWPCWPVEISLSDGISDREIVIHERDSTYDVRVSPLKDWRGGLVSRAVVLRDITEHKRAEELLHESEEKFRTIFENASDEIIYLDRNGTILDVNRKVEDIFGYTREELIGRNFVEFTFFGEEDTAKMADKFRGLINGNITLSEPLIELELRHRNGSTIFVEVSTRIISTDHRTEGILGILRDVTERKRSEEKIKASLKEKEVLLREIHHRVKNNMQVVSSLLNLQSLYMKDTSYAEMLRESQNRIRTMSLIHENLYQSEDLSNINFSEYICTLVYGLAHSYREGTQQVDLTFDIDNVNLGVDAAIPCGLIINELVTNSLKHAFPHGKRGEIAVSCHSTGGALEFTVRDNGVGIPEGVDFKNSGSLGLHLVTILAEDQLNGRITLSRKRGTEFCITFKSSNGG